MRKRLRRSVWNGSLRIQRDDFFHLSFDLGKKLLLASLEQLVAVDVTRMARSLLLEVVHVELSDKGTDVIVLKVLGKYLLTEISRLLDDNRGAFCVPVDNLREELLFKDTVDFADEGRNSGFIRLREEFGSVSFIHFGG